MHAHGATARDQGVHRKLGTEYAAKTGAAHGRSSYKADCGSKTRGVQVLTRAPAELWKRSVCPRFIPKLTVAQKEIPAFQKEIGCYLRMIRSGGLGRSPHK